MHWTYEKVSGNDSDLQQGDILTLTPEFEQVIHAIHPYFIKSKYIGFIVLTQSCDLVRRKKDKCKAEYINLAVLRDLEIELPKILKTVCEEIATGIYSKDTKQKAEEILSRILNQNEQALGLFYLHPCADSGISENVIAFLRISIALRAEHYKILVESRKGRLSAEFRDRLGWLTGNLYSRVGTKDWSETEELKQEQNEIINLFIEKYLWIDQPTLRCAEQKQISPKSLTPETLKDLKPRYLKDEIIKVVCEHISNVCKSKGTPIREDILKKIENRLKNDSIISRIKG